ncbi:unnamed protein product, partial [Musa textilis]
YIYIYIYIYIYRERERERERERGCCVWSVSLQCKSILDDYVLFSFTTFDFIIIGGGYNVPR